MKKKIKKAVIALMVLVVLSVIGLIIINIIRNNLSRFYKVSDNLVYDNIHNNEFSRVIIKSNLSEINLNKSDNNNIRVVVYGYDDSTMVDEKNNNLIINIKDKKCYGICFENIITKIDVYLPSHYNKVVEISGKYSNIKVDEFIGTSFDIENAYGDVSVLEGNFVRVANSHGNISVVNSPKVRLSTTSGDIKVKISRDVEISNRNGDITLTNVNGYLDLNNDYGDVKIDSINLDTDSNINVSYGNVYIKKTNEIYINANTDLGDIEINNNYKKSNINLNIKSEYGDIVINNKVEK